MRNARGQQGESEQHWKKKRVLDTQPGGSLAWRVKVQLVQIMDYKAVICFPTKMSARYLIHRLYI